MCDVDRSHAQKAKKDARIGKDKADVYEDYRQVLDRKDIDAVIIGTPDHWHTKILIDAMKAGKDVYCEKPMTLTIDEGRRSVKWPRRRARSFRWARSSGAITIARSCWRWPWCDRAGWQDQEGDGGDWRRPVGWSVPDGQRAR